MKGFEVCFPENGTVEMHVGYDYFHVFHCFMDGEQQAAELAFDLIVNPSPVVLIMALEAYSTKRKAPGTRSTNTRFLTRDDLAAIIRRQLASPALAAQLVQSFKADDPRKGFFSRLAELVAEQQDKKAHFR